MRKEHRDHGLSVAVAFIIRTVELSGLVFQKLNLSGGFWAWWEKIDINLLGFIIVGLFLATSVKDHGNSPPSIIVFPHR